MLQNPCMTYGFKKNMVYKIPPWGEVNQIKPVAYWALRKIWSTQFPLGEVNHIQSVAYLGKFKNKQGACLSRKRKHNIKSKVFYSNLTSSLPAYTSWIAVMATSMTVELKPICNKK